MPTIELTDAEAKILSEALQVAEESYKGAAEAITKGPNHGELTIVEQQIIKRFGESATECKRIALKLQVAPKPKRRKARK